MSLRGKDRVYRFAVALAFLYVLLALRYWLFQDAPAPNSHLQALALAWAFAVTAVVASVAPARSRPPHLRG